MAQTRNWFHCAGFLEFAGVPVDLFAGIQVSDSAAALHWYERLFGSPPSFVANETERRCGYFPEHGFVFVEHRPEHAGQLVFVEDRDPDVNESGFGAAVKPSARSANSELGLPSGVALRATGGASRRTIENQQNASGSEFKIKM